MYGHKDAFSFLDKMQYFVVDYSVNFVRGHE